MFNWQKGIRLLVILVALILAGQAIATPDRTASHRAIIKSIEVTPPATSRHDGSEPYGVKSAILKKALRKLASMLRSSRLHQVLEWLADETDRRIVGVVRKHAYHIADTLDDLCKWESLTLKAVQDQIAVALRAVGVAESTAREVAFWLKNLIEWTLL